MTTSKKLSILQILILLTQIVLSSAGIIILRKVSITFFDFITGNEWTIAGYVTSIIAIAIGALQIIFKFKEGTSIVYLIAGLCSLLTLIPFAGAIGIAFNIIGIIKRR